MPMIRPAKMADITFLCRLGRKFFEESNLNNLTFDINRAERLMSDIIMSSQHFAFISENSSEKVNGFICFDIQRYYTVEKMAHIFLFFVHPNERNKGVGRALLKAALNTAQDLDARYFYGASTGGFDDVRNDEYFRKLFLHYKGENLGSFIRITLAPEDHKTKEIA